VVFGERNEGTANHSVLGIREIGGPPPRQGRAAVDYDVCISVRVVRLGAACVGLCVFVRTCHGCVGRTGDRGCHLISYP